MESRRIAGASAMQTGGGCEMAMATVPLSASDRGGIVAVCCSKVVSTTRKPSPTLVLKLAAGAASRNLGAYRWVDAWSCDCWEVELSYSYCNTGHFGALQLLLLRYYCIQWIITFYIQSMIEVNLSLVHSLRNLLFLVRYIPYRMSFTRDAYVCNQQRTSSRIGIMFRFSNPTSSPDTCKMLLMVTGL